MESDEQRRRRYEQLNISRGYGPDYGVTGGNSSHLQHYRGAQVAQSPDQFRHGQLSTTRVPSTTSLAAGAGPQQDVGAFAYSQGQQYPMSQMHAPPFPYQPEYLSEPQRPRFPQYQPQMTYNFPQQAQPPSPYNISQTQSSYDPIPQFQPRQTAAADVLSNQFGVPPNYYSGGDTPSTTAPSAMSQGYQAASYQPTPQYNPQNALGRSTLASPYPAVASDFAQGGGTEESAGQDTDMAAENTNRYYRAIGETNHYTYHGMLIKAGSVLKDITDWLLVNAVSLGFARDDREMHAQRLTLWDNFNNCWLALLQRQLDDTQTMLDSGRSPIPPRSLLPLATLEKMGDELVAHCDELGKFGLVDYQMGVAEEEIIDMLNRCIDLLRPTSSEDNEPEDRPGANHASQRRAK